MLPTPEVVNKNYDLVYEPAEDTFLLLDLFEELQPYFVTKEFSHKTPLVVEIGTGSGIVSTFINKYILPKSVIISTDLNPHSCVSLISTNKHNNPKRSNLDAIRTDLVSGFHNNSIDVLVFNPPYVPAEYIPSVEDAEKDEYNWVDIALNGGPEGMDITNKLLDRLDQCMSINGEAYILFCARNKPDVVVEEFKKNNSNFSVERVIYRKAGWEELSVYRFLKLR
ncbi:unnamed protein product [Ambrosiozyma monospora]|uniref:Unnamed protein product n=1 Tax=Ambrosiozyma monospora TaxID=43982 RepID=A0ACB5SXL8_AMBMO|nr:unnamed protein product [Ambrosiozyma monospora]